MMRMMGQDDPRSCMQALAYDGAGSFRSSRAPGTKCMQAHAYDAAEGDALLPPDLTSCAPPKMHLWGQMGKLFMSCWSDAEQNRCRVVHASPGVAFF
eukprot:1152374-Pelagomonas_calceolata.AAC.6